MRRRHVGLALLLTGAILLTGCAELVDIERRALVVGAGVDLGPAGIGYRVTVQYPAPEGQGGGGGGGSLGGGGQSSGTGVPRTIGATGVNVGLAMDNLRQESDRFLYLGNLSLIAIGMPLAEQGALTPLDFFLRSGEVSESAQIVVTTADAGALLQQKAPEGVALPLFEYLRQAEVVHVPTSPDPLWRFMALTYSKSEAAYAPIIAPSTQGQAFTGVGTALFLRGRMVGTVTGYQTSVLDWLIKKQGFPDGVVTLPGAAGPVTLRVVGVTKRLQVVSPSDIVLHMRFQAYLREGHGLILDDKDIRPLEGDAAAQLTSQVRGVLDELQKDGTDVIGLAPRVHARYPDATADWPAAFSHLHLGLDVSIRITGGGRET